MRLRTLIRAGAACALASSAAATASPASAAEGFYVGMGAGWDLLKAPQIRGVGPNGTIRNKSAVIVSGALGYKFPHFPVRLEVEGTWSNHEAKSFLQKGTLYPITGHLEERALLFNALYDMKITPRLRMSLGGGAGIGTDRISFDNPFGAGEFQTGKRMGFMWQAIGGLAYTVTPSIDVYAEYRYRDLNNGSDHPAIAPYSRHHLTENVVMAGLRWSPWAGPEKVAAPPPPPPRIRQAMTPPPPPPPVKTFIVFFDFNKSDLTAEAQGVISQAVKTARETNSVRVLVTGHTDTVGSDRYNQALSERRAGSVKAEMIRDGMTADAISTVGKGFSEPLVATGPGVREPQNRRAVIDLGG